MRKLFLGQILCLSGLACLALLLGACAERSMMSSFQDITSDSQRLGFFMSHDRQFSGVSLTGFIASPAPGFLYAHSPARGPMAAVGITGGGKSYIVTKTVESSLNDAEFKQIKQTMEDIKLLSMQLVQLRMDKAMESLESLQGEIDKSLADSFKELFDDLKKDVQKSLDTDPVKQLRADAKADLDAAQKNNEAERSLLEKSIGDAKAEITNARLAELAPIREAIARLHPDDKGAKDLAAAKDQPAATIETVEAQLALKEKRLAELVSTPGVLIFRWAAQNVSDASANLAGIMGGGGQSEKTLGGYAIVSGLRMATLYIGSDIHEMWKNAVHKPEVTSKPMVTTMVAQARRIAYVSELNLQQLFAMKAELDAERLGKIAANWQTMLKLTLAASMARVAQMSNTGVIGDMVVTVHSLADLYTQEKGAAKGDAAGAKGDAAGAKDDANPAAAEGGKQAAKDTPEPGSTGEDGFMKGVRDASLRKILNTELKALGVQQQAVAQEDSQASAPFPFDNWTTFYHVSTDLKTLRSMVQKDDAAKTN